MPERSRHFGGSLLKGNPKQARPLSSKEAIHLVLKSHNVFGPQSMLQQKHVKAIRAIVDRVAERCAVRVYHFVNVGNHLHLVIKLRSITLYAQFIRALTGLIARQVLGTERGKGRRSEVKNKIYLNEKEAITDATVGPAVKRTFWVARPFTRLVAWGRDYNHLADYMKKNQRQSVGIIIAWGFDITDPNSIEYLNTG